jgi:hypothetical protein
MELAEEVYRIIPQIKKIVDKELLIQKYTGHTSKYWTDEFVKKGNFVRLIFTSNKAVPYLAITSSWNYSPYEVGSKDPEKKYVKLQENGEWYKYKPLKRTAWEDRWVNYGYG